VVHETDGLIKDLRALMDPEAAKVLSDDFTERLIRRSHDTATEVATSTLQQSRLAAMEVVDYAFTRALVLLLVAFGLGLILSLFWRRKTRSTKTDRE
jgi:hypothetical protein